ncbi:MAG: ribosome biogenesis GTPase YlqF [Firmicutes bacterium]|nr:ribosome biogenesis GTPase YlqF [Bacillota bacterium]
MDMYQKRKIRAEKKNNDSQKSFSSVGINWYPGHMAKTKRLISENIDLIDVVYEVIDARIPYSSKVIDLDNYIKNKPRVLIITKYDLCDKIETNKWIKYYEQKGYKVFPIDLEHSTNLKSLISMTNDLLQNLNEKNKNKGLLKRKTRVLVVGIPNAGKSTLINRLVSKKVANVGNKPGVTKNLNWIRINNDLELLDTPGILWPKIDTGNIAYNLATFTAIKEEVLPIDDVVSYILKSLHQYYPNILKERYGVDDVEDIESALEIIGKKRGCLAKGGIVDYDKVYSVIINDIKLGNIKGITFDRL